MKKQPKDLISISDILQILYEFLFLLRIYMSYMNYMTYMNYITDLYEFSYEKAYEGLDDFDKTQFVNFEMFQVP